MIRHIAAIDIKRGLASHGRIPWNLPSDKARFRKLTLEFGGNVLVGRNTYEQMGDYFKDHRSYIASRSKMDLPANCTLVSDIAGFLANFSEDLWVIGGEHIYAATIDSANELYLTIVEADFNCDQFFPDYTNFKIQTKEGPFTENNLKFSYQLLTR